MPVSFGGCTPPLGFRQYQTIELSKWHGRGNTRVLDPLLEAIEKLSSSDPAAIGSRHKEPTSKPRRALTLQFPGMAAVVVLALIGAGILYPRIAASGPISPKISLGAFALNSPGLPRQLPDQISDEILAAFGAENAVAVVAGPARSTKFSAFVMDGSIGREGQIVRFTVNLKDSGSGMVIWSQAYDRDAADSLAPRQVAVEASQVVRCGLWGAAAYTRRMPDDALALYLRWCNEHWGGSGDDAAELDAARAVR